MFDFYIFVDDKKLTIRSSFILKKKSEKILERKTELGSEKCYSKNFFHADSADLADLF